MNSVKPLQKKVKPLQKKGLIAGIRTHNLNNQGQEFFVEFVYQRKSILRNFSYNRKIDSSAKYDGSDLVVVVEA
jgi:hypothetical protein